MILLAGGIYYLSQSSTKEEVVVTPKPTTPNTPAPLPIPSLPTATTSSSYLASTSTGSVTGQVNPNGALTSYYFEYGETTSLGSKTNSQEIGSGFATLSTPAYISGLKANTIYYFRLGAKNTYGTVNGAVYNLETNNTPPVLGSAPTPKTLSATDVSRVSANLRGQINPNDAQSSYWFEYGKDINFGNITAIQNLAKGDTVVTVAASVANLEPLSKYYFRINSQNQYGTVNGIILNFTTLGPVAMSSPSVNAKTATSVNSTNVVLNGSINPNGGETTYWFEYSQDSLLGNIIGNGTSAKTLASGNTITNVKSDISSLAKDTKYYFHLVARNQAGTTESNIMSFTTKKN